MSLGSDMCEAMMHVQLGAEWPRPGPARCTRGDVPESLFEPREYPGFPGLPGVPGYTRGRVSKTSQSPAAILAQAVEAFPSMFAWRAVAGGDSMQAIVRCALH